eukprot:1180954-Prorocentrum_minimum.AAC.2
MNNSEHAWPTTSAHTQPPALLLSCVNNRTYPTEDDASPPIFCPLAMTTPFFGRLLKDSSHYFRVALDTRHFLITAFIDAFSVMRAVHRPLLYNMLLPSRVGDDVMSTRLHRSTRRRCLDALNQLVDLNQRVASMGRTLRCRLPQIPDHTRPK